MNRRMVFLWFVLAAFSGICFAAADEKSLFECTFQSSLAKPCQPVGGVWRVQQGCLQQVDAGLDDPCKMILDFGESEELSSGVAVIAKLRLDVWANDDQARAGVGLCCDPESGHGLNLVFHRGQLQFVHDYVAWAPGCAFPCQTGTWYWMKLCKTPGALRGKAWRADEPEPTDWMVSWTDFDEALIGYPALVGCSGGSGIKKSTVSFAECRVVRFGPAPATYYTKKATWQETMAASLDSLARQTSTSADSGSQIGAAPSEVLWGRLRRDFSDPQSRRQMAWERQDGIWPTSGPSGTVAALAERYAGATRPVWPNRLVNWPGP